MKIPKRPTLGEILSSPTDRLAYLQEVELAHDLMNIVLDGAKYMNACTAGERTPEKIELDRFNVASMELRFLTEKHGWDLPTKIIESLE